MAENQSGLLEKCTGYNDDPSGPFGLSRGGLVRNLRPATRPDDPRAAETQTTLEYSRDGKHWGTFRVYNHSLQVGDVTAIRAELFEPKLVPEPPAGATRFVWCYCENPAALDFSYAEGKRPETYRSTYWVPTRWHSCWAFDDAGNVLGYFSPNYPNRGWEKPEGFTSVMDSLSHARRALRNHRD